jgi:hypothetical protein
MAQSALSHIFYGHKLAFARLEREIDRDHHQESPAFIRAYDRSWEASDQVIAMPAADVRDLAMKVAVIRDRLQLSGEFISSIEEYVDRLFDDVERLARADT